jgi:hypothetical protein
MIQEGYTMVREGYTQIEGDNGFLLLKLPQDIMGEIKTTVDEIQNDFTKATSMNHELAGQIDKEYKTYLTPKATDYIRYTVDEYNKHNPDLLKNIHENIYPNPVLEYDGYAWVNFQEKYEYNPMHIHDGVFSYVIWYQIPFYREDEITRGAGKLKIPMENQNGAFNFIGVRDNRIITYMLDVDKTKEGFMAVFPSTLNHLVHPFYTSDDYRITVSGNILMQGQ